MVRVKGEELKLCTVHAAQITLLETNGKTAAFPIPTPEYHFY